MARKQASAPEDSSGDLAFTDTVVQSDSKHSHTYSPNASASSILFDCLEARATGAGGVGATAATVSTRMKGKAPGRVRIDVRGGRGLTTGARAFLSVLDGNKRHEKKFTRTDGDVFLSWTRRVKPGEVIQLSLFATCRITGGENPEGLLQVDSIDIASLPAKK